MARVIKMKSCGTAHIWCGVCRPDILMNSRASRAARARPKREPKVYVLPCRNCGRCDACLGITAPEGMKRCRRCGETKPLDGFYLRPDTNGYRNHCNACRNVGISGAKCETCGKWFARSPGKTYVRCRKHRHIEARECRGCGTRFMPNFSTVYYCSSACLGIASKAGRARTWAANKRLALQAYGGESPACACCGESQPIFLSLDHINGGGRQERIEKGGGGFYSWLKANKYPPGFRVLCHNCNMGRQINGGTCPHQS